MIYLRKYLLICLMLSPLALTHAQNPDFEQRNLAVLSGERFVSHASDISASAQIYSTGKHILLVVDVKDDEIRINQDPILCDHIELWLALPSSAYPSNFEYAQHPQYVYFKDKASTDSHTDHRPRFFSVYSEYSNHIQLDDFLQNYDYPDPVSYARDKGKFQIPPPEHLDVGSINYGVVHYGLYPDEREVVLFDREDYDLVEEATQLPLGKVENGIRYLVETTDEGYTINAQISIEALGFVQLPSLNQLRFAVNVVDVDNRWMQDTTILSTCVHHPSGGLRDFNRVEFRRPIRTNVTNIPDSLFHQVGLYPVYMYTDSTWSPTYVDSDALVYAYQKLSDSLIEVRFSGPPLRYSSYKRGSLRVQRLTADYEYVNAQPNRVEYVIINGIVFKSELVRSTIKPGDALRNRVFRFPDGTPGLILKNNLTVNPFGWGDCGTCIEEVIGIHRIVDGRRKAIFSIYQGDGANAYCQIKDQSFKGFFVQSLDWAKPGEMLILRLESRTTSQKKRVRVWWEDNGSEVKLEVMR